MRAVYSLAVHLLRPIAFAIVMLRSLRNPLYRTGWRERFALGERPAGSAMPLVWVHAVSLGEVNAAASLVRALLARETGSDTQHVGPVRWRVLLTTATPTGRERAAALFGAAVSVRYLPYDTPGAMRRFVRHARPRIAVIMETELWPNLFDACRRADVPVVLANARLSGTSVSRYRHFGVLFRGLFKGRVMVAAQSTEDAARFVEIGAAAQCTEVMGNLKFELDLDASAARRGAAWRSASWPNRSVWIAGSTHAGEEDAVLDAHGLVRARVPGALLLLVPRHPQRFESVAGLIERRNIRYSRRSIGESIAPECEVLLIDTVGELLSLYAAADVAFVGGSLVPIGGHNLIEPAALGVPIVTGPSQSNAREIAELLIREGAAVQVDNERALAIAIADLLCDSGTGMRERMGAVGRRLVAQNRGALERLLSLIDRSISPDSGPPPAAPLRKVQG